MTAPSCYLNNFQPTNANNLFIYLVCITFSMYLCPGAPVHFEYLMVLGLESTVPAVESLLPQETVDFPGTSLVLKPG